MTNQTQLAHLGFSRYQPSAALAPWVDWFWQIERIDSHYNQVEYMHPEGGSGIIFNFADPLLFNSSRHHYGGIINGPASKTTQFQITGTVNALGIRFKPGALPALINMPASELTNFSLSLTEPKVAPELNNWAEQLSNLTNTLTKIQWLEQKLLPLFVSHSQKLAKLTPAIQLICQQNDNDGLAPNLLAEKINLSQRQFERLCLEQLGMSAKKFSGVRRTIAARKCLRESNPATSLTELAMMLGFYDQAHFIHQFKQVIGITPGQFRDKINKQ
ncbi:helix-turn-helix domain-containing protein [Catenovulum sp. 2E275]|uniref:AraC family transcriptional regulator n=1 Tax=Catenovulum sp. 2E275 TaxID=2980497 RepID=UPI0021D16831|nr:helix-turn-helix domain-containing protein [Catenovulum sp. 2E275]MCU4674007.1 helix-turn-helix domain-containing protein [Catenovulum sp. 2E275]